MAESNVIGFLGLNTNPNELGVPPGSLVQADNCVIRSKGILESRRGQAPLSYVAPSNINELIFYKNTMHVLGVDGKLYQDTGSTFSVFQQPSSPGAYQPTIARQKFAVSQQSLFQATAGGLFVSSSLTDTGYYAGANRAFDITMTLSATASVTCSLPANSRRAYKVVMGTRDQNGRVILGAPSGRTEIANTTAGNNANAVISVFNPPLVPQNSFYQIYATRISPDAVTPPIDNYYQVKEVLYSAYSNTTVAATAGQIATTFNNTPITVTHNAHGFVVGQIVNVRGATGADLANIQSGDFLITGATANTFTYNQDGNAAATTTNTVTTTYIPAGFQFTDSTPDVFATVPLYTNAIDGAPDAQENTVAPCAVDVAEFQNRMWFANTRGKQRVFLQLAGVPSVGNTLQIGGLPNGTLTVTFVSALTTSGTTDTAAQVVISASTGSDSTTTTAIQIQETARNLCQAINGPVFAAYLQAYYVSSNTDLPGKIVIEERGPATSLAAFTVYTPNNTIWVPALTTFNTGTSATLSSSADQFPGRLFYSKLFQPESVPLLNYLDIGKRDFNILRIVPTRTKLYVFKEDGIFVVYGNSNLRVDAVDLTVRVLAADTVVSVANQIYAYTNQGVVSVSDSGVAIVSGPIDNLLAPYLSTASSSTFTQNSFACSYESEHQYILTLSGGTAVTPTQTFVLNVLNGAWTRWLTPRACARVNPQTDTLYTAGVASTTVYKESKTFTAADYGELSVGTITATNYVPGALTVTNPGSIFIGAGCTIVQAGTNAVGLVTGTVGSTINMVGINGSFNGTNTCTVYQPVPCTVELTANDGGSPGNLTNFRTVAYLFKRNAVYLPSATTRSDFSSTTVSSNIVFSGATAQPLSSPYVLRQAPAVKIIGVSAINHRVNFLSVGFSINEALSIWSLLGVVVAYDEMENG